MSVLFSTSSNQIVVEVFSVNREIGYVSGGKTHKQRNCAGLWAVHFRNDEPLPTDGGGRPHPKLVMAAAQAAWRNCP